MAKRKGMKTASAKAKGKTAVLSNKFKDLTGQTFGYLTVLSRSENNKQSSAVWSCSCICSKIVNRTSYQLKRKRDNEGKISCGCKKIEEQRERFRLLNTGKLIDLKGLRFGRWKVLKRSNETLENRNGVHSLWLCQCDCGKKKEVFSNALRSGASKSCGCLLKENKQNKAKEKIYCMRKHILPKNRKNNSCKECQKHNYFMKTYAISLEEYNKMLDIQNYRCAICKNRTRTAVLNVDHDHITGKVRGLLCSRCNTGLGRFQDRWEIVNEAANYLAKTQNPEKP